MIDDLQNKSGCSPQAIGFIYGAFQFCLAFVALASMSNAPPELASKFIFRGLLLGGVIGSVLLNLNNS